MDWVVLYGISGVGLCSVLTTDSFRALQTTVAFIEKKNLEISLELYTSSIIAFKYRIYIYHISPTLIQCDIWCWIYGGKQKVTEASELRCFDIG